MGWVSSKNYGIAKENPKDYGTKTSKPSTYGKIKDWVYAGDYNSGWTFDPYRGFAGDINWKDNPYKDKGWFPVWYQEGETNTNTANTQEEVPKTPEELLSSTANQLSDPNSKYYTDFSNNLKRTLSAGTSTSSLLAFNRGMGLGTESSALLANEQNKANLGKINDVVVNSTKDLFLSNTGNAINASNSMLSFLTGMAQLNQNQSQYNQTRSDSKWNQNMILLGNLPNQIADIFNNNNNTKISGWNNTMTNFYGGNRG